MKKIILSLILIFLLSCFGKNKSAEAIRFKTDTAQVLVIYGDKDGSIKHDLSYRIIRDTVAYVKVDNNTLKLQAVRDTFYYIFRNDTIKNKDGTNKLDSLKQPLVIPEWKYWDRKLIFMDAGDIKPAVQKYQALRK